MASGAKAEAASLWRSPHEALHAACYTPFESIYFGRHVSTFAAPNKHLHMLGTMDAIFHKTHHLLQPLVGHHSASGRSPASRTPLEHQISLLMAGRFCREDNWQQLAIAASQAIVQYANHDWWTCSQLTKLLVEEQRPQTMD